MGYILTGEATKSEDETTIPRIAISGNSCCGAYS